MEFWVNFDPKRLQQLLSACLANNLDVPEDQSTGLRMSLKHILVHSPPSPVQCLAVTGVAKWKISKGEAIPTLH